jgi:acetyl-CoA C-acetyltransferase
MYIKGVGMTKFGISDKSEQVLAYEAALEALSDADMTIKDIDAIAVSNLEFYFHGFIQRHMASMLSGLFKVRKPVIRTPAACGGSGAAFWTANRWKEFDNVLVLGAEKLMTNNSKHITEEFMMAAENHWEQNEGLNFPMTNALVAQQYLNRYDCTMDDLAMIAYKNHQNALKNPKAFFYKRPVSLEKIKSSPVVAKPFRLFDCSVSVDGASAAVLTKDKTDVKIVGSGLCVDYMAPFEREDVTTWDATVKSSREAFKMAGLKPEDIDVAELHDAFTMVEMLAYEDVGFVKKGQGSKYVRDGHFEIDGKLPVNTSGGLKAKGHPVSATGLAQINEIVLQLRSEAVDRQIQDAKYGLTQNIGGAGGTISVHVLKKV